MTETRDQHDAVVIERIFDGPVDVLWELWTAPEHFKAWYGPAGATIPVARMDVRVGGERLVCMEVQTPDGTMRMWFAGQYREVIQNERLVYTESVSDETGAVPRPADSPEGHPGMTEVRVELTGLGDRTRIVLTHVGIPPGSPGATGWAAALDKLAVVLAGRS